MPNPSSIPEGYAPIVKDAVILEGDLVWNGINEWVTAKTLIGTRVYEGIFAVTPDIHQEWQQIVSQYKAMGITCENMESRLDSRLNNPNFGDW